MKVKLSSTDFNLMAERCEKFQAVYFRESIMTNPAKLLAIETVVRYVSSSSHFFGNVRVAAVMAHELRGRQRFLRTASFIGQTA